MPKTERRAEAIWIEARKRWQINAQKDGERKTFTSSTPGRKGKHEAELKADKWLECSATSMTFAVARDAFLAYTKEQYRISTYSQYEYLFRCWITPNIKKKSVDALTPMDWQNCINKASASGKAKKTCADIRGAISAFIMYCHKNRWKIEIPIKGEIVLPKEAAVGKRSILQPDGLKTLFQCDTIRVCGKDRPSFFIYAWRFAVITGLRRGEISGLRWDDKEGDRVLHVQRSRTAYGELNQGKTANAARYVALSNIALATLENQKAMLKKQGIISPWIFPWMDGNEMPSRRLYSRWKIYRKQHGIECSLHELRHTFVSVLKSDMPEPLLKSQVGHGVETNSLEIYGHPVSGDIEATAKIIDEVFGRILGK